MRRREISRYNIMEQQRTIYIALLVTLIPVPCCFACNGFSITKQTIRNCNPNGGDVVTVQDFKVNLNENCTVKVTGCFTLEKQINSATVRYTAKKGLVGISGNKDICKEIKNATGDVVDLLNYFKIKPACPFKAMKVCGPAENYDINKYKGYLSLLQGDATADLTMKSDSGPACIKAAVTIVKKGKAIG